MAPGELKKSKIVQTSAHLESLKPVKSRQPMSRRALGSTRNQSLVSKKPEASKS